MLISHTLELLLNYPHELCGTESIDNIRSNFKRSFIIVQPLVAYLMFEAILMIMIDLFFQFIREKMQGTYEYQTKMNELSCALIHECKYAPPYAHLSNNIRNILERCNREIRREIVSKTEDGCAPLFIACRKGNVAIVNYLINVCNADIEQRGRYQAPNDLPVHCVTSLWCAAVCGHLPVVKSLIFYGAEIDAVSGLGSTPVRSACFMNHLGNESLENLYQTLNNI